jgi:hypothetical protein
MRKTTGQGLLKKADFLSNYLEYKIVIRNDEKYFYIWFDYGCEGSDCIYTGTVSECNNYLNAMIRRNDLKDEWIQENR